MGEQIAKKACLLQTSLCMLALVQKLLTHLAWSGREHLETAVGNL
jgi:hypothetical protein